MPKPLQFRPGPPKRPCGLEKKGVIVYPEQFNPTSLAVEAESQETRDEAIIKEVERLLKEQDQATPPEFIRFWVPRVSKLTWFDLMERARDVVLDTGMLYIQTGYYKALIQVIRSKKPPTTKS